ncbi:hypothetical protein NE237_024348 [Protea cynaroides]|uniref:Uncharacterized protein n=1 Tax=Protea cynaroides TaxID=273540 RepID=A0A9Q0HEG3_9MAGN|nr:hypothetical protein NE237_024348 [Protea cynaroides]
MGYPNIILQMLSYTDTIVNSAATEAVLCLNCIDKNKFPASTEIPSTRRLMKKDISLSFFRNNRVSAVRKISQFVTEIGPKAFDDIMDKTVNQRSKVMGSHGGVRPIGSSIMMGSPKSAFKPFTRVGPKSGSSRDDRTIFVTFSRGYPISENELRNFFNMNYGECVESIYMQEVSPYAQALFALVVFRSKETMGFTLESMDDEGKVRLKINGKHARARKYFPKMIQ